jgi:hypothetical protein
MVTEFQLASLEEAEAFAKKRNYQYQVELMAELEREEKNEQMLEQILRTAENDS